MRFKESGRTAATLGVLLIQLAAVWELWRTRAQPQGRAEALAILSAALLLTAAVHIWERLVNSRRSAEAQRADDEWRLAMKSGRAIAWDWDVQSGRAVLFGDLTTMFGIAAHRHVGDVDGFRQFIHPGDREAVWRAVAEARESHAAYVATFRIVWPDGKTRWVTANGEFSYGGGGEPLRMRGIATDITDRHDTENDLRASRERLAVIVQSATDAIITIDDEQRVILFNPAAETLFGCAAADALGSSIDRFIPSRNRLAYMTQVGQLGEPGTSRPTGSVFGQLWAVRVNGDEFPVEASMSQADVRGRKIYTAILRDRTERQKAEHTLRDSEERFRLIADTAPIMLWMSDPDNLYTYFNRSWLAFTGRTLDAELGTGWAASVHPDDLKRCLPITREAFAARQPFTVEYRLRRQDGQYRWIRDAGVPRFALTGAFAGYIGSAVDFTSHKESLADMGRQMLEAHEVERDRIARELHDDIGQRMALLAMELDGLCGRGGPRAATNDVRIRLGAVTDQARELAKDIQAISNSLHSSRLDYLGLVPASAGFCREVTEQHGLVVRFRSSDIPDDLSKDVTSCLYRVLQEVVNNVMKHAGAHHVAAELRGGAAEIRLEVVDDGIGFDPEAAVDGPGLGLISMKQRLGLIAGGMTVESRPGAGTTVRAWVPVLRTGGPSAERRA